MGKHIFQLQSVHKREDPLPQRFGDLESNEVVILLRGVPVFRDLYRVKSKLCFQMGGLVLRIAYRFAKLRSQFGILNRDRLIHRGVTSNVRCVMR